MFKIVQKLGKFVVKMYYKEATRLKRESAKASEQSSVMFAVADEYRKQGGECQIKALNAIKQAEEVQAKAKALEGLFYYK